MIKQLILSAVLIAGGFTALQVRPWLLLDNLRRFQPRKTQRKLSAKEYMQKLEGRKREGFLRQNMRNTQSALVYMGQGEKYKKTVFYCAVLGVVVAALGFLLFRSPLFSVVVGGGCAFIPLWMVQMSVYSYTTHINGELEIALNLITTSYSRTKDLISAVEESAPHTNSPVTEVLSNFVYQVRYVDSNIERAIYQMQGQLDSMLFRQWCDILILCQDDYTMISGLFPIVSKFSQLKKQQMENQTEMMRPLRDTIFMAVMVGMAPLLLYVLNWEWYQYLAYTTLGHLALCVSALVIFFGIQKAIKLSKPLDYFI